jgi:putative protease
LKSGVERKIGVSMVLSEIPGGFLLEALDEDGNLSRAVLQSEKSLARDAAKALETAQKQLAKTGGTEFECKSLDVRFEAPRFIPVSELNAVRRDVLAGLAEKRKANMPRVRIAVVPNDAPYPERTLGFKGNVLNAKAESFYRRHGVQVVELAAESGLDMRGRTLMRTRLCVLEELGWCMKRNPNPQWRPPYVLVDENGRRFELKFDCEACGMEIVLAE